MKRKIIIRGKVHNVGYRPFLLGLAETLGIKRFFADNVKVNGEEAVEILIEAPEEKINSFHELIKRKKPENAKVESIKVEEFEGNIMEAEAYYRFLSAIQLSKIATYGGQMLEKQDKMLEKQDKMLEKQDSLLNKQDSMLGKMDMMLEKQDKMLEKQDITIKEIKNVSSKLDKTNELLDKRFERLEQEVEKIKKALIKAGIEIS
ncbi:acylphosphatase [Archaeoglobales archaeon]|nr:MAG: acylphosphatase [Archaeoglobales archaeon]